MRFCELFFAGAYLPLIVTVTYTRTAVSLLAQGGTFAVVWMKDVAVKYDVRTFEGALQGFVVSSCQQQCH